MNGRIMVLIRTLLISLILLCGVAAGSIQTADFVSFVWDAGGAVDSDNGGGTKKSVWNPGTPDVFFTIEDGSAKSAAATHNGSFTACTVVEGAGDTVKVVAPNATDFEDVITGLIANIEFETTTGLNGRYFVTAIDDDELTIDGLTYSVDLSGADDACDIWVGGIAGGIVDLIGDAADLVDATSVNCEVLIKGNETLAADLMLSAGGGTVSTMLHFLGVDSSWVRIVPTRVTASGGSIANGLLDTSIMPTLTCNAGVSLNFDGAGGWWTHVDGIYITGSTTDAGGILGTDDTRYNVYTNCVIRNTDNSASVPASRGTRYSMWFNCDILREGATQATFGIRCANESVVQQCLILNSSSSATSVGVFNDLSSVSDCLFYDFSGVGVWINTSGPATKITGNTFYNCLTCVQLDNASLFNTLIVNNLADNCTNFATNASATDSIVIAMFNRLGPSVTNDYESDIVGDVGFQDITSATANFVSTANKNFNLTATSPAKEATAVKTDIGSHPSKDAAGGGQPVLGGSVVR